MNDIANIVARQRAFFETGKTLPVSYRKEALMRLREAIRAREGEIAAALKSDLGKSASEAYMCETGMVLEELSYVLRHMAGWAKRRPVLSPLAQFPSSSFTVKNPYGVVLVMSPWNYPFMLTLDPLIGALAAGNCCVLKPSAYAPATAAVIETIGGDCSPPEYVAVVQGGRAQNQALLEEKFDYIFFTGGMTVGREVMRKAAEHLTPVSLELGGKSPCVVDKTAKLDLAARRLAFGKLLNCGQTCVAPDYVLIDRAVKDEFIALVKKHMAQMIGEQPLKNDAYVHMISRRHYDRVLGLIDPAKVVYGGKGDEATLRIEPTILDNVTAEDAVMQEEIFGPVLPIVTYDTMDEAVRFINSRPHPLALYLFSEDKAVQQRFLDSVPYGGGCINDVIIHLATSRMGFGGVGESGMGSYHGKLSFETFSHEKSIVKKSNLIDLPFRDMPYTAWKDALIRMFLK